MSSQKKGFLQLDNVIIDHWMSRLTNAEFKTLLAIVRKTKGWNKPYDRISQTQIAEITGLTTRSVRTAITALRDKNLIIVVGSDSKVGLFSVNYSVVGDVETDATLMEKKIADAEVTSRNEENTSYSDAEVISNNAEVISQKQEVISNNAEVGFLHNIQVKDTINRQLKDIKQEPKKKTQPKKKKHDFPSDFAVTETQQKKCDEYGINSQELVSQFDDFHSSKGNQFVDWSKAFNTWLNNHIKFEKLKPIAQGANYGQQQSELSHFDKLRAEAAAKYGNQQSESNAIRTVNQYDY